MIEVTYRYCSTRYGDLVWDNIIAEFPDRIIHLTLLEKLRKILEEIPAVESIVASKELIPDLKKLNRNQNYHVMNEEICTQYLSERPVCFISGTTSQQDVIACVAQQVPGEQSDLISFFDLSTHFTPEMKRLMSWIGEDYLRQSQFVA